ncbi:MAG: GntR family transcriptional regulator [Proteobacteria bacterium]|nr:GntR family transcriptional regulator [Pseudomonadota bacterium]
MESQPSLRPVERRTLADGVYAELSDQILHGAYAPGQALPPERELAERLGVRRGALREGIKRLEQVGLIQVRQGGGTFVQDYRRTAGLELLPQLLMRPDGRFDFTVVRAVMEMRAALAPDVARQAARRRRSVHLSRLAAVLDTLVETDTLAETGGAGGGHVAAFWDELVEASDNVAYRLAYNALLAAGRAARDELGATLVNAEFDAERFGALLEAVRDRDTETAGRLAGEITRRGAEAMERALARGERS